MKKFLALACALLLTCSLCACTEPNFKEAKITLDKIETAYCDYYHEDRMLLTFTFTYIKEDIAESGDLDLSIYRDNVIAPTANHPIYWTHFKGRERENNIELKNGYTFSFQVCARSDLDSISFTVSFFTHIGENSCIYTWRSPVIQLEKDDK